jgi:pheromone shutdown-related protein TraB
MQALDFLVSFKSIMNNTCVGPLLVVVKIGDGITLVGTAHVSKASVETVEETIRSLQPDKVLVELDAKRFEALQNPDAWKNTDIIKVIKDKKQHLFMLQLYLASMQSRMGRETGSSPGAEMLRAVEVADEIGAEVVLIDRDVQVTLKRGFGAMGFWGKLRLTFKFMAEMFGEEKPDTDVDALLETDAITQMTEEFATFAPKIKTALIDERDSYMASHVLEQSAGSSVVAIVGAGHIPGMTKLIEAKVAVKRDELDVLPRWKPGVGTFLGIGIPAIILGISASLIYNGNWEELRANALYWIIVNGALSGLGVVLARGHILSAITAVVMAPLTSLSPALAAGWFAGITEAKVHTPKVGDFEAIKGLETMKEFWRNDVIRVLLVVAFANIGSMIGTFLGLGEFLQSIS